VAGSGNVRKTPSLPRCRSSWHFNDQNAAHRRISDICGIRSLLPDPSSPPSPGLRSIFPRVASGPATTPSAPCRRIKSAAARSNCLLGRILAVISAAERDTMRCDEGAQHKRSMTLRSGRRPSSDAWSGHFIPGSFPLGPFPLTITALKLANFLNLGMGVDHGETGTSVPEFGVGERQCKWPPPLIFGARHASPRIPSRSIRLWI